METIFMNTKNSWTKESKKFIYYFTDKLNKNIALDNLSIYYTCKNIESAYNKNKSKMSALLWDDEFDLPDV